MFRSLFFNFVRKDRDEGTQEVVSQITAGFANNFHSYCSHLFSYILFGSTFTGHGTRDAFTGFFSFVPTKQRTRYVCEEV
jgi:hypothetical protein